MKKTKLLSTVALSALLSLSAMTATAENFDNVPEEEIAKALVKVLKKEPKIAYDAMLKFQADAIARSEVEDAAKEYSPLEKKVAEVLKNNPPILVGAMQIYEQELRQKELEKTAETYQKNLDEINSSELTVINPNGTYTMVEFFDFSCGYCKQMAPRLVKVIKNNPDVKLVLKPLAFLSQNSVVGAKAAVAADKQGKFLEMYERLMKEVGLNKEKADAIAKDLGLDMTKYQQDYEAKTTENTLNKIRNTANKINLKSVPTLVLNGLPLYAVEETQIQNAIDILRKEVKKYK